LVCVNGDNFFEEYVSNIKRISDALIEAIMVDGQEMNIDKIKHTFKFHQNKGQNHNFMTANKTFENV